MKTIILNEERFRLMLESMVPDLEGGDLKEYPGSEVGTTTNVTNQDGDIENGEMPDTDRISRRLTPQQWGSRHGRRGGYGV